jgi:RND family efflux transporter MFP subunit
MGEQNSWKREGRRVLISLALGAIVIGLAVVASLVLLAQRKPPVQAEIVERAMRVEVLTVHHEDTPVFISGYGEARARDEVIISPEVAGRVESVHPHLEVGRVIPCGDVLFTIDAREYRARVDEAQAGVEQWRASVQSLVKQFETDKARLATYASTRDLASRDLERVRKLYSQDAIESETSVDAKETQYNAAQDAYNQFAQTLALYPIRIEEAKSSLAAVEAALERARIDLERTTVVAPFDARLKEVNIEANERTSPGAAVLTLADDSELEIAVPLNSVDASQWLQFEGDAGQTGRAWFRAVRHVPVEVAWTESPSTNQWQGTLDRVTRYDDETRTVTVAVKVPGEEAQAPRAGNLPLVAGMFCRVRIPGKVAEAVVRLPAEAVGFDLDASGMRTVYVARHDDETSAVRLETRRVKESHADGQDVFVFEGLADGEQVIVTRLVNPLERSLLDIREAPVKTD